MAKDGNGGNAEYNVFLAGYNAANEGLFLGVHHSIGKDYLQNYLNEYCYKLNRRNFNSDLFDRMIIAGANDTWY